MPRLICGMRSGSDEVSLFVITDNERSDEVGQLSALSFCLAFSDKACALIEKELIDLTGVCGKRTFSIGVLPSFQKHNGSNADKARRLSARSP
jgi:hypothetical protein